MIQAKDWLGRTVEMEACGYKTVIRKMVERDLEFGDNLKTRCGFKIEK